MLLRNTLKTSPVSSLARSFLIHTQLGTWEAPQWRPLLQATVSDENTRVAYD